MSHIPKFTLAVAGVLTCWSPANATQFLSFDNGWYDQNGTHIPTNPSTMTGYDGEATKYHGWWAFDLSNATQASAVSITFTSSGSYLSHDNSEFLALYDYTGSVDELVAGTGGVAAYDDLGSGTKISYRHVHDPDLASSLSPMPVITMDLSSAFVTQFNSLAGGAGATIAIGAALNTINFGGDIQTLWSGSNATPAAYLTITPAVPEPATWLMMIIGFGAIGYSIRARKIGLKSGASPQVAV